MIYLKKYGLRILYTLIFICISLIISTALYYFNIINNGFYKTLKIIITLLAIFINSYILGKQSTQKGYLEGLKFSLLLISIFFILTLITKEPLKLRLLLYYIIVVITSIFADSNTFSILYALSIFNSEFIKSSFISIFSFSFD